MRHKLLWPSLVPLALATVGLSQSPDEADPNAQRAAQLIPSTKGSEEAFLANNATNSLQSDQEQESLLATTTPIHNSPSDLTGVGGGTFAAGQNYKASFHGLPTFIPYLGKDYPHNQPLAFNTRSILVGGVEQIVDNAPGRRFTDDRYELVHGSIVEAYDVRVEGLEQTYTFTQRLPAGDLEIVCGVESQLVLTETRGTPATVHFHDASGTEILTYGEAVVFDAAGRRAAVQTTASGTEIRLNVPASWLADAKYPVTVDPLVSVTLGAQLGGQLQTIDSTRDDGGNDIYVAYTRFASAADEDLFIRGYMDDFTGNTTVFADLDNTWDTQHPQIAVAGSPVKIVAAFNRRFASNTSAIRLHYRNTNDFVLNTNVTGLGNPAGTQTWRADIGGTTLSSSGDFMLVTYQQDVGVTLANTTNSGIGCRVMDITGAIPTTVGTSFVIPVSATSDAERPSVNQIATGSGTSTTWIVAYQRYDNNIIDDDWDINAKQVDASGNVSTATWFPTDGGAAPTSHRLGPQIAGRGGRYGVAFSRSTRADVNFKTALINGHAFDFERFDWPIGGSIDRSPAVEHWPYTIDRRWESGACAYDHDSRSHWAYTNRSNANFGGTGSSYVERAGYTGGELENVTTFSPTATDQALQGGITYDDDADDMVVTFGDQVLNGQVSATTQVMSLARFDYPAPVGPVAVTGVSCSAATISWSGFGGAAQQIGSEFSGPRVSGAPAGSAHLIVVSLNRTNVAIVGSGVGFGCRLLASLNAGYLGLLPLQVGANITVPLPIPESIGPLTLIFQDFHTNAAGSQFLSTQRLEVPLTK